MGNRDSLFCEAWDEGLLDNHLGSFLGHRLLGCELAVACQVGSKVQVHLRHPSERVHHNLEEASYHVGPDLGSLEVLDWGILEEAYQGNQVVASLGNLGEACLGSLGEAYQQEPVLDSLEVPFLEGHHSLVEEGSLEGDHCTSLVMYYFIKIIIAHYQDMGFWGFGEIGRASCRERV